MQTHFGKIARQPGRDDHNADTSLRGKALERALGDRLPTTLTPHEWEQWYAEHGVPASHRQSAADGDRPWWQFWKTGP
jgi:hypothetical protein